MIVPSVASSPKIDKFTMTLTSPLPLYRRQARTIKIEHQIVIPAQAGIQPHIKYGAKLLDSCFHRNDKN